MRHRYWKSVEPPESDRGVRETVRSHPLGSATFPMPTRKCALPMEDAAEGACCRATMCLGNFRKATKSEIDLTRSMRSHTSRGISTSCALLREVRHIAASGSECVAEGRTANPSLRGPGAAFRRFRRQDGRAPCRPRSMPDCRAAGGRGTALPGGRKGGAGSAGGKMHGVRHFDGMTGGKIGK